MIRAKGQNDTEDRAEETVPEAGPPDAPSRRAVMEMEPSLRKSAMPWIMAFSTMGCSTIGGIGQPSRSRTHRRGESAYPLFLSSLNLSLFIVPAVDLKAVSNDRAG